MFSTQYFALLLAEDADNVDRRRQERRDILKRRRLLMYHSLTDTHFIQRYRLSKEAFEYLCSVLAEKTSLRSSQRVSLDRKVLCALLFFANGDYQRVVGVANDFSQEAISRFVEEVTTCLNHPDILNYFIKFPCTRAERDRIKQRFQSLYGFPGVVGCVDGCHFRIFKPKKSDEHLFYCRKHYHSLNVQMICDYNCRILSVNAKFGGATHDAFVWESSRINSHMQRFHTNGESVWLLGDSGYPLRPWLMTPYSNPAPNTAAETFNDAHSRVRVNIENTFGRLKNRWRCTCKDRVLHYKPEKCARIILACCVLHNLAIEFGVPEPIERIDYQDFHRSDEPSQDDSLLTLGRMLRDRIAESIHSS